MRLFDPARCLFPMALFSWISAILMVSLAVAADVPLTPRVRLGGLAVVTAAAAPPRSTSSPSPSPTVHFREIGWKIGAPEREMATAAASLYFLGGDGENPSPLESKNGWGREFIAALGRRFLKEEELVRAVRDASHAREQGSPEMVSEFTWYDGDFREVDEARRDLVVNLVSGAAADTLEKTAPGRWIRALEDVVDRYSRVSYRRAEGAETGRLFLPGQFVPGNPAAEDPVAVTAGARLHLNSDNLAPDVTFAVLADYFGYRCRVLMNPVQGEAGLFFASRGLERLLGVRAGLGLAYDREGDEEETVACVFRVSGDF